MKIPYNFSVNPVASPQVRKVNDRTLQADAIMAEADQQLTSAVGGAVATGNEIYQGHIQKQYDTDMVAGAAMMDQLKAKRDGEIANIPVGSGIDRAGQVKKINDRYNSEWEGWAGSNIRNKDHRTVRNATENAKKAFANDGATYSARQGVAYDQALNISNLDKSIAMQQSLLVQDPTNAGALAEIQKAELAKFNIGAQTEAMALENNRKHSIKALDMQDANTMLRAEVLAAEGDYEAAEKSIDSLSSQYTADERSVEKTKILANGTYNRFKLEAQQTNTVSGWDNLEESLKENKYPTDSQRSVLNSSIVAGREKIKDDQTATKKRIIGEAKRGIHDPVDVSELYNDDSKNGLSMVGGREFDKVLNKTVSLYESAKQVKEDGKLWKAGSAVNGGISFVGNFNKKVTEAQLEGNMSQEMFTDFIDDANKRVKDGDWSPALGREAQRIALNAFESSLEGETAIMGINDGGFWGAAFDEPMPDSVKSVYRAVNNAYQDQKLSVNEYIDAAPYYASIREDLLEWSAINPNWSPTDVQKKIEKLIEPIKAKTRDVIANRNANK
jgi:hypothetical protein